MSARRLPRVLSPAATAATLWVAALPLHAQVQQHDVTPVAGPDIAGGPFAPRPPITSRADAAELEAARVCVSEQLDARSLMDPARKEIIEADAQEVLIAVVLGAAAPEGLAEVLARGGAVREADDLARTLAGIVTRPRTGQLAEAIRHFNALIERSDPALVDDPPPELVAVRALLSALSLSEGCVPPARVDLCLVTPELALTTVEAFLHPVTGDTLLYGRPFRALNHEGAPQYAASREWFAAGEPITYQGREFLASGEGRRLSPDELLRAGEFDGVPVFTRADAVPPVTEIYLPSGPGCEFQPYVNAGAARAPG